MHEGGLAASRTASHIRLPGLVSITGGGGKTTLLFALARLFSRSTRVITSTTTKICMPANPHDHGLFLEGADSSAWRNALRETNHITVGEPCDGGKMAGFAPEVFDGLYREGIAPCLLLEADGAKHLPFKGYASYEPVVPDETTCQIVVVGAEVLFLPITEQNTFRLALLEERWGLRAGRPIPLDLLVRILESPAEYLKNSPPRTTRILMFNKCDLLAARPDLNAADIAAQLTRLLSAYDFLAFVSLRDDVCYCWEPLARRCGA